MRNKILIATVIIIMACIIGYMVINSKTKVELVKTPKSTMEPYEILNEWDVEGFKEYGFDKLELPADVYYEQMEKGESYTIGTFYTDNFDRFKYFFQKIYTVLWGRVYDIEKVLELKDGVYSFSDKSVVQSNKKDEYGNLVDYNEQVKYVSIYVEFDSNENKVTLECRKIKEEKKKSKSDDKAKDSSAAEKKETETDNTTDDSSDEEDAALDALFEDTTSGDGLTGNNTNGNATTGNNTTGNNTTRNNTTDNKGAFGATTP